MGAPKTQRQMADELSRHMEQLYQRLEHVNQELGTLNRAFDKAWGRRKRRRRWPLDPFELLKGLMDKGLKSLERTAGWLVDRVMG